MLAELLLAGILLLGKMKASLGLLRAKVHIFQNKPNIPVVPIRISVVEGFHVNLSMFAC
jgi:hypothetical protein